MILKFRVLNQFGASEVLSSPEEIEVYFPYETTEALLKRFTLGDVNILNDAAGEVSVELSDFEVQGLSIGEKQNIEMKIHYPGKIKRAIFAKCLNVRTMDIDGTMRKVVFR